MKTCSTEKGFIQAVAPAAQKACKRYGFLPSVMIAQAAQELGYAIPDQFDNDGIYDLLKYNNMIGQKRELLNSSWSDKTVWDGRYFTKTTPEEYGGKKVTIKDDFRIYDDIEQSFCDYLLFLLYASNDGKGGKPKYGNEVVEIKDYKKLIQTIRKRGYATDSSYDKSIIKIIEKHGLTKYDDLTGVEASDYIPDSLKPEDETPDSGKSKDKDKNVVKIGKKKIINIMLRNRDQVPASRGDNPIKQIVCHYLGVPNADNPDLYGGGYGGHFNIQRNGEIYQAADPKTSVVWHCGGGLQGSGGHSLHRICTNYNSIGIECGVCYTDKSTKDGDGDSDKWYFTEETQESLVWLVSYLMDRYNIPESNVIRHYDVTGKTCLPVDTTEVLTKEGWKHFGDLTVGEPIACYDPEEDHIIFDGVQAVVPPYDSKVIKSHYLEATPDHRMWVNSNMHRHPKKFREVDWETVVSDGNQYTIKNAARYASDGLPLTDDEIRLLVWIQGDGHYMTYPGCKTGAFGLEFHLSKQRKIARITALLEDLGIAQRTNPCANGSVHIRVYSVELYQWAEKWLTNKAFSWKLLEMNDDQFAVFAEELFHVDGHVNSKVQTSMIEQNLDVVQALCALHEQRASRVKLGSGGDHNIAFAQCNFTIGRAGVGTPPDTRTTSVSCVSVPTGFILIRQNNRTFIVGNCPNPYVRNNGLNGNWTWAEFKANLAQYRKNGTITIPDRSKTGTITVKPMESTTLRRGDKGDAVKELQTRLIACGYSCGSYGADGSFGGATENALKAFQSDHGLDADGIYGAKSKAALETAYSARKATGTTAKSSVSSAKNEKTADNISGGYVFGGLDYSPIFDPAYYLSYYPDLSAAFGTNNAKAWQHFITYGRKEARRSSKAFDPHKYRARYKDLDDAFGNNWAAYYEHYLNFGIKEKRKAN